MPPRCRNRRRAAEASRLLPAADAVATGDEAADVADTARRRCLMFLRRFCRHLPFEPPPIRTYCRAPRRCRCAPRRDYLFAVYLMRQISPVPRFAAITRRFAAILMRRALRAAARRTRCRLPRQRPRCRRRLMRGAAAAAASVTPLSPRTPADAARHYAVTRRRTMTLPMTPHAALYADVAMMTRR